MSFYLGDVLIAGGSTGAIDDLSITKNANNEMQAIGLINQLGLSSVVKTWVGTLAEYEALGTYSNDTLYNITDDYTSGESSYNDLTNLPQINGVELVGNKTTADLNIQDDRILPDGYTITVATDDSGDFTDVQSALNSLQGKVCAGTVTISIAAGTYNISGAIKLWSNTLNLGGISILILNGANRDTTILNIADTPNYTGSIDIQDINTLVIIKNLTFINASTKGSRIAIRAQSAHLIVDNIKASNWNEAVSAGCSTIITVLTNLVLNDCTSGILTYSGWVSTRSVTLTFTNVTTAINVLGGGIVNMQNSTKKVFTSVTNQSNVSIGVISANGYLGGALS